MGKVIQIELEGFDEGAFSVLSFGGTESLSSLWSYAITLAAKDPIHNFDDLLEAKAHLSFGDPAVHVRGMLCSVQQGYDAAWTAGSGRLTRVDVVMVPELWKLTLYNQTRFFRDMSVPDIIQDVISQHGLTVELSCRGTHPTRESVLQYQETDLDFIQRLAEHEGIHYHHVHSDDKEALIFGDSNSAFGPITGDADIPLRTPKILEGKGNLGPWGQEQTIVRFQSRQRFVPKKVILQDYNDQDPGKSLKVEGEAPGKASDGIQYYFAENYKKTPEGDELTKFRKEEIIARKRAYFGAGNVHRLFAGGTFKLVETDAIDAGLSQEYLVTEFHAEGSQPVDHAPVEEGFHYANNFTCIPESIVFRPERRTPWPVMPPLVHAKVIASGEYADVEDQGRYRVQFVFDIEGAGSIPLRLMEPYVGADYGFHAPLHEGVEVLVAFENGDPDRPIIVSAAHNPDFPNTVKSGNHTQSIWRSGGNNEIKMEDTGGSQDFYIHASKDYTTKVENDKTGNIGNDEKVEVKNNRERKVGVDEKIEIGSNREKKVGADEKIEIGANQDIKVGGNLTEAVDGNKTGEVKGNLDEKVDGNMTLSVTGTSDMTYTGDQTVTLSGKSTVDIGGDATITIGGKKAESIGSDSELTVGGDLSETVGGDINLEAGGDLNAEAGGDVSIEATVEFSASGLKMGLEGKAEAELKSDGTLSLEGGGGIEMKGSKFELKSDGEATLKGSVIKLN
ncbi:MAG TPA: type VI secretion system tip protein TssI/VgrG [Planctomycetota bacterium]|jgi:type VI secretion system secreted protein VgrG